MSMTGTIYDGFQKIAQRTQGAWPPTVGLVSVGTGKEFALAGRPEYVGMIMKAAEARGICCIMLNIYE